MHAWLPPPSDKPLKVANCFINENPLMLGPLEIINLAAARSLEASLGDYTKSVRLDTGEDRFLHDCAKRGEWDTFSDAAKMGSILTDEQCWPTFSKGCGQDCIAFHPFRELDEFMVCHNDTRARTQEDENVVTWFDDDTEMQTSGPHTGASSPFGRMKNVRDDGRNDIRPGLDAGGANPLWSKNGETPNPVSGKSELSEAQKEAQKKTAEARKEAEAKQKAVSREVASKAEAAVKAEAATRAAATRAAAKMGAESRQASRKAEAASRAAARKATIDEAATRRESTRATRETMRKAAIGTKETMQEAAIGANEAEAASREAATRDMALRTDPK